LPRETVSVIDVNADKVVATIPAGGAPVQFTMRNSPTLLELAPNPAATGSAVTLSGESFVEGASVRFAAANRSVTVAPTFLDSQGLRVNVPALQGASSAVVDVLHPDGNSSERVTLRLGTAATSIFAGGVVEGAGLPRRRRRSAGAPSCQSSGRFLVWKMREPAAIRSPSR
jgi:YVTN family beta-propeller protein